MPTIGSGRWFSESALFPNGGFAFLEGWWVKCGPQKCSRVFQHRERGQLLVKGIDMDTLSISQVEYNAYIHSPAWAEKRDAALSRAENHCQLCCATVRLTVHHNTYERLGNEHDADLVVLCKLCHDVFHAKRDQRTARKYADKRWIRKREKRSYSALPPVPGVDLQPESSYFTDEEKDEIRTEYQGTYLNKRAMAAKWKCSTDTIGEIVKGIVRPPRRPRKALMGNSHSEWRDKYNQDRVNIPSAGPFVSPAAIPRFGGQVAASE